MSGLRRMANQERGSQVPKGKAPNENSIVECKDYASKKRKSAKSY